MKEIKKITQSILLLLFCLFIFSNISSAVLSESLVTRNSLFIRSGYSLAQESSLTGHGTFSAGGMFFISKKMGLEFEGRIDLMKNEYDNQSGIQSLWDGELVLTGANISLFYMAPISKRIGLYFLGGIGYSFNDFSIQEEYDILGFQIRESIKNSISFHAGVGLDIAVFKRITLNLDIRYSLSNAEGMWSIEDNLGTAIVSNPTETNLNRLTFMLGIKFLL